MALLIVMGLAALAFASFADFTSTKELREKRKPHATRLKELSDKLQRDNEALIKEGKKTRDFNEAEQKEWDAADLVVRELDHEIIITARYEVGEAAGASLTAPAGDPVVGRGNANPATDVNPTTTRAARPEITEENRSAAFRAWFKRNGAERRELTDEERDSCKLLGFNPDTQQLRIRLPNSDRFERMRREGWGGGFARSYVGAEERALSAVLGSTGGFTIPATLINQLEINMLAFGGVLQAAQTIRTASGERMTWPTATDTSNSGRQLGESAAITTTAQPTFGAISWDAYKFTSDGILVPTELLEDSAFDLPGVIGGMLGERIGRILNTKFTTGTGAATPKGIVTCATVATLSTTVATTASATAIAWDEITDLIHTVDPAYRAGSAFMFHDGIYQHIRKLKDGFGRPLWADGPNSTPPATLQGYPYFINQDMQSTVAASTDTMLFGQLSKYKVRQVNDIRLYRLIERQRENDQDEFLAFIRADGNLLQASTVVVRKLTQHA